VGKLPKKIVEKIYKKSKLRTFLTNSAFGCFPNELIFGRPPNAQFVVKRVLLLKKENKAPAKGYKKSFCHLKTVHLASHIHTILYGTALSNGKGNPQNVPIWQKTAILFVILIALPYLCGLKIASLL